MLFTIIGATGMLLIIYGLLVKSRKSRDYIYVVGGLFLTIYSIIIQDIIFIMLQIAFMVAAIYDLFHLRDKH